MTSLIETIIWAGLVIWLVIRFEKSIAEILATIKKRIDSGGDVKLGPIELSQLKPQSPSQQAARTDAEIEELIESKHSSKHEGQDRFLRQSHLIAEELAVRAIEAEFGQSIQRQVQWQDHGFDGIFAINGQAQIIEIKYFTKRMDYHRIKIALAKTKESHLHYGWKNVRIVFVIVTEEEISSNISENKLEEIASELEVNVLFRSYSLKALQEKFGA